MEKPYDELRRHVDHYWTTDCETSQQEYQDMMYADALIHEFDHFSQFFAPGSLELSEIEASLTSLEAQYVHR
jgi:hypothetical protein